MAQRTVALCDGKYIGIETIYTVINGKQINIPEKLNELRLKSRNNELFCPCGCGANLVLVAGDKNLREQHFRIKDAEFFPGCRMVTEGKTSVDSKIVIKCWLDDNIQASDLESRVPICAVEDNERKYEFTFISREKRIAVNYCHDRRNLSDEKLGLLEANSKGIKIIHIVDRMNSGSEGQYPEGLMKVQDRQGYILILHVEDSDYETAVLQAAFNEKDLDGLWQETVFVENLLCRFRISDEGYVSFNGEPLDDLLQKARVSFRDQNEKKKARRAEAERQHQEWLRQQEIEREKRLEEAYKKQKEHEDKLRQEEADRKRSEELFMESLETALEQQETQVRDPAGNRWVKCKFCGKIAKEEDFASVGGLGEINRGTCKECQKNNPVVKEQLRKKPSDLSRKAVDPTRCPRCGGMLREKNGPYGKFIGCTNWPGCTYRRSVI